ncbi:mRNA cap guanine-N7 methyltransferase 2 [Pyrus ussuriensis x Pyrus communis]|uniref:mRNA cap guanine-N7 methyltransferase 2 n=1 Tax=Pyrus ussuriensis x Pyrus communis TaxID=2448454 RepID=A0A5N5I9H3_9ROSA|nr:mRNA cap guanine-N7 methyltransferase 2 [Pyrus ussuriensis x Pyrus communis]
MNSTNSDVDLSIVPLLGVDSSAAVQFAHLQNAEIDISRAETDRGVRVDEDSGECSFCELVESVGTNRSQYPFRDTSNDVGSPIQHCTI